MPRITNDVLAERLQNYHDALAEKVDGVNKRLDDLNGQVSRNTSGRNKQFVINSILGIIGSASLVGLITIFIDKVFGG